MSTNKSEAEVLANRPYVSLTIRDQTENDTPVYVAYNGELPGCMAQGATIQEALENLAEVRIAYIEHLLDNGLRVPEPTLLGSTSSAQVIVSEQKDVVLPRHLSLAEVAQTPRSA